MEFGAKLLKRVIKSKKLFINDKIISTKKSKFVIISIGTPINKSLKPKLVEFLNFFKSLKKYLRKDQIIIIRSSIYPGTFDKVKKILKGKNNNIFYCPERIVQGKSLIELPKLPQIISGVNNKSIFLVKNI